MRFSVIFLNFLVMVIVLVSMDATTASAPAPLVLRPGRRSISKWSHAYHSSPEDDQDVKGITIDTAAQVAGHGVKPINGNSRAYLSETQSSSNMEDEEIVYTIDYHGATTHPTPTPKHPIP